MRRFLASIAAGFLLCSVSLGQSAKDRFEVFGGYSFVTGDFTGTFADRGTHILSGWNVSANYKANQLIGLVADVSGFHAGYTTRESGARRLARTAWQYYSGLRFLCGSPGQRLSRIFC
jgi:hypothetical protein